MRSLPLRRAVFGLTSFLGIVSCSSRVDTHTESGGASGTLATGGTQANTTVQVKCAQGETRACVGPGACRGGQSCDSTGVWSTCDCGQQGSGGASFVVASGGSSSAATSTSNGGASVTNGGVTAVVSSTGGSVSSAGASGIGGLGTVGGASNGGVPNAGGSGGASCVASIQVATFAQFNMLILLDKTGSMGDDPNGGWANAAYRWNPIVTTLDAFFQDQKSTGIYASLSFLPADGDITSACKVTSYSAGTSSLKVPLTLLDNTGISKFLSVLCDPTKPQASTCVKPAGGTPTRPALQGTIDYLATVQQKFPDSNTVIVFLTDGEPGFGYLQGSTVNGLYSCDDFTNGCPLGPAGPTGTGTCSTGDAEVQKVADVIKMAPAKSIYLFGVGELSDTTMSLWADASKNPSVSLKNMSAADAAITLRTAFESIRSTHLNCSVSLPAPSSGGAIDPSTVNVTYVDAAGNKTDLVRDSGCTHSGQWGWQYDNPASPKQIQLCSNACANYLAAPAGHAEIALGCASRVAM